jgi:hypothetical protein
VDRGSILFVTVTGDPPRRSMRKVSEIVIPAPKESTRSTAPPLIE